MTGGMMPELQRDDDTILARVSPGGLLALAVDLMGGPDEIGRRFDEVFSPGTIPPALAGPKATQGPEVTMDWLQEMHDESRRTFDNGGDLPVGLVQVLNTTSEPEKVYTARQVGGSETGGNECPEPKPPAPDA